MITKNKVLDVLEVCIARQDADMQCRNCIYKGEECITAHKYAKAAVRCLNVKEVYEREGGFRIFQENDPDD